MTEHPSTWGNADTVVLDIGAGVGALILYTGSDLLGAEIEISPSHEPTSRAHTAVRERHINGRSLWAAIFFSLDEGTYTLWRDENEPGATVTVLGGEISAVDWRPAESRL